MITEENVIVIKDPKTFFFNFDWPKYVDKNLKREIKEYLYENKIKTKNENLLLKYKLGIGVHTKNSKRNEPHKFVLNFSQRLDLKCSDKLIAFQNLSIYYTWKYKRK